MGELHQRVRITLDCLSALAMGNSEVLLALALTLALAVTLALAINLMLIRAQAIHISTLNKRLSLSTTASTPSLR